MDNDNLNQTQNSDQTANPQNSGTYSGASNGADFQSTAPAETLDTSNQALSVQETGEPLTGMNQPDGGMSAWVWVGGILAVVVIVAIIVKLLRMDDEPAASVVSAPAPRAATTKPKSKATPAKKTPAKSKQQKRRKSSKKRR